MFKDITRITIRSGKGGNGHVSFRREKYVPNGGPDGGDGGKGGDVIFIVEKGLNTLGHFNYNKRYSATDGEEGGKRRCHGKNGNDIILKVPDGTIIKDAASGKVIVDMSSTSGEFTILSGGRGGIGNMHFATSTMQTPRYAKPGEDAKELDIILELKLIADVGLVGLPNAGKSSLLARVTNANPKIADYPFTTIDPNLGMVNLGEGRGFLIADIPGIIEGASDGVGLGHDFLKHIERNRILIHLVDISSQDIEIIENDIKSVLKELEEFNSGITKKPILLAANKIDTMTKDDLELILDDLSIKFPNSKIYAISTVSGVGVDELIRDCYNILQEIPKDSMLFESEFDLNSIKEEQGIGFEIEKQSDKDCDIYIVTGSKVDKMLGYTNLESAKGFNFFQNFIKDSGIEKELKNLGIKDGDTVNVGGIEFEYYN